MFSPTSLIVSHSRRPRRYGSLDCGGKGASLLRMARTGLPVPGFVIIPCAVFERAAAPFRKTIDRILDRLDPEDRRSCEAAAHDLSDLVAHWKLPAKVARDLASTLNRSFPEPTEFAVRSSVRDEDSCGDSFAGQMDSFLHVRRDDIGGAINRVWASAYSSRALAYRHRRNLSAREIAVAVIVQAMVPADRSGILFTRDPETGQAVTVIAAGFGLGEGIVGDRVESDTVRVEHAHRHVTSEVRRKGFRVVRNGVRGGTRVAAVPDPLKQQAVLNREQARALHDLGVRIEALFGAPQDVEWAIAPDGRVHILQSRPITTAESVSASASVRIWDNSNIVESYPGLTRPLTFSFIRTCYRESLERAVRGFLVDRRALVPDHHRFDEMVGLLSGRVYYNLLNWYRMYSYLPGFRMHKEAWDQMVGIRRRVPFPERRLGWVNRVGAGAATLWRLLTLGRNAKRFERRFRASYRRFCARPWHRMDEEALASTYREMAREFTRFWHLTLYNDFGAMVYYDLLARLCRHWGAGAEGHLQNDLLCGQTDLESTRPLYALLDICAYLNRTPELRCLFSDPDDASVWARIQTHSQCTELRMKIERYVQAYGDRGTEELKLEVATFREHPEALVPILRSYRERGLTREGLRSHERRIRGAAEAQVRVSLSNPLKRLLFAFVLHGARRAVTNRENMRFARSRLFGLVRRLFARMGEHFCAQGLLRTREDLTFLTVEEVFCMLDGTSVTRNLQALVDLRRAEYDAFAATNPPARITTSGVPSLERYSDEEADVSDARTLRGTACASGVSRGSAWVVSDPGAADRAGDYILVARSTDPGWIFLMIRARGIVVEKGSVLSHTAIVGRELGIPTVVGVEGATRRIHDGARLELNGNTGEVRCLSWPSSTSPS